MTEEDEFNEEFDRLVQEKESCPVCHRNAVELGNIHTRGDDGERIVLLYAICEIGHAYIVHPEEDDD